MDRAKSAIPSASRPTGGCPPVTRRTVLAFILAMAASAVLAVPVRAASQAARPRQNTETPCSPWPDCTPPATQAQCTDGSAASQCAGQIDLQDPALTQDRVHVTGTWWTWLIWLALTGVFVAFGFRRPLLRALRAASARTEETAYSDPMRPSLAVAPKADMAPDVAESQRAPRTVAGSVDAPAAADPTPRSSRSHQARTS